MFVVRRYMNEIEIRRKEEMNLNLLCLRNYSHRLRVLGKGREGGLGVGAVFRFHQPSVQTQRRRQEIRLVIKELCRRNLDL